MSNSKITTFNSSHSIDYDRRKNSVTAKFPLIDSDGTKVEKERRLDKELYLKKLKLKK